jgi:hypothetical protein
MRGALSKFVWLMSVSRTRKNFSASMCVSRSDWCNAIPVENDLWGWRCSAIVSFIQPLCENSMKVIFRMTTEISSRPDGIRRLVQIGLEAQGGYDRHTSLPPIVER